MIGKCVFFYILFELVIYTSCYQIGDLFNYKYESNVEIFPSKNRTQSPNNYGYKSNVQVKVLKSLSEDNYLLAVKISDLNYENSKLFTKDTVEQIVNNEFKLAYDIKSHKVLNIYLNSNDPASSKLFKKGIADLFNLNLSADKEDSLIGSCDVKHKTTRNETESLNIIKYKSNCLRSALNGEYKRKQKVLNSIVDRNIETEFRLNSELVETISSVDSLKVFIEFNSQSYQEIKTKQTLKLEGKTKFDPTSEAQILNGEQSELKLNSEFNFLNDRLEDFEAQSQDKKKRERAFEKILKSFGKKTKTGTKLAANSYLTLVKTIRSQLKNNQKLLESPLNYLIKNDKNAKIAVEAYLGALTELSVETLSKLTRIKYLDSDDQPLNDYLSQLLNSILISSSLSTRPSPKLLNEIIKVYKNDNKMTVFDIKEKAALSYGSLVDLLYSNAETNDSSYAKDYLNQIKQQYDSCVFDDCRVKCLQSLKNSKLDESFGLVQNRENCLNLNQTCLFALKSMDNFRKELFTTDLLNRLLSIFYNFEGNVSSELRLEALNLVLDKYIEIVNNDSSPILFNILLKLQQESLKERKNDEFRFYCQRLITQKMKNNPKFKSKIVSLFSNSNLKLNYFDFMTYTGSSNHLAQALQAYPSGSLSYSFKQLMTNDGYMKLVDFGVSYYDQNNNPLLDFLKFEIFANNLNAITGGGGGGGVDKSKPKNIKDDANEPTADLHLTLMGQKIKIDKIFKGYSSMIALVWNLPTKLTSIFNINLLINDQNEYIILNNGMAIRLQTIGALSLDLSGLGEVSFWSMYAKTHLKISASFVIEQKLALINDFTPLNSFESVFDTQFSIDFYFNSNFKQSPAKLCVKMSHKKFYLREIVKLYEHDLSSTKLVEESRRRIAIQASTFMFSRKAISFC